MAENALRKRLKSMPVELHWILLQVLSADWVRDSMQIYSENIKVGEWITSRYGGLTHSVLTATKTVTRSDTAVGSGDSGSRMRIVETRDLILALATVNRHEN